MQQINKYSQSMRIMHWIVGTLILAMLCVGLYMTSDLALPENKRPLYNLHKSFGIVAIFLVIIRISVRLRSQIPQLPKEVSFTQKQLALKGHYFMYCLLILIPITGFLMSEVGGYPIMFFGYELPHFLPKNQSIAKFMNQSHTVLNYTLIGMLVVHLAAPFKHYFIDNVNIWKRMM